MLPRYDAEGVPIEEVAKDLTRTFENAFDILLPFGSETEQAWNWQNANVWLQLRNVTASEIFNAMNLVFEAGRTPLQWDLIRNGNRSTALLRNLHAMEVDPLTGRPIVSRAPAPVLGAHGAPGVGLPTLV